jgi:phosphohistidine swiveling domain-containing protein
MRAPNGIPLLPARIVAQLARTARDAPIEPIEVVLVAHDYQNAASLSLPWAHVVGIVAEHADVDAVRLGIPTVVGIEDVLAKIDDDALVLINGERGIVLVDPDGVALAAYQAERERIAPRRRIYLDFAHQPAHTLDGREMRVLALVRSLEDVQVALDHGADALHISGGSPLVPSEADEEEQAEALWTLAEAAAGKLITVAGEIESISAAALLRAATRAEFILAAPMGYGVEYFARLQTYLQDAREALIAEDIDFAEVRLAGTIGMLDMIADGLADYMLGRVVVDLNTTSSETVEARAWLDDLISAAKILLVPVEVMLPKVDRLTLESALGLGAAGLIVAPDAVQTAKEIVRTLDASMCRAALFENNR